MNIQVTENQMAKQIALVTGAGRGIGRAAALALANAGFDVALNDLRSGDDLDTLAAEIKDTGQRAHILAFDVSDTALHAPSLSNIEARLGPLTTLVNNAGVGVLSRGDPLDVQEESFDRCMTVNAKAPFFLTQSFARRLLSRQRDPRAVHSVINITSSNATAVAVPRAEYCASKAAASMTSRCFAARLGPENILVYDVQPGLIATPMTEPVIDTYQARAEDGLCLLPRVGQPEEVASVVANLASGCLPYTTGHVISVDGGMLVPRF